MVPNKSVIIPSYIYHQIDNLRSLSRSWDKMSSPDKISWRKCHTDKCYTSTHTHTHIHTHTHTYTHTHTHTHKMSNGENANWTPPLLVTVGISPPPLFVSFLKNFPPMHLITDSLVHSFSAKS